MIYDAPITMKKKWQAAPLSQYSEQDYSNQDIQQMRLTKYHSTANTANAINKPNGHNYKAVYLKCITATEREK